MADVAVDVNISTAFYYCIRIGPWWTSATTGYTVYIDVNSDLVYNKTSDGGATWDGPTVLKAATVCSSFGWPDWQTTGDSGTKINIAYFEKDNDDCRYMYLDTSDDSFGGDAQVDTHGATLYGGHVSITKTRGGVFFIAGSFDGADSFFFRSTDASTWIGKTSPYDAHGDAVVLCPANLADSNDIWATYFDASDDHYDLKTYDDSGNSWSAVEIDAAAIDVYPEARCSVVRHSDGHLIGIYWNAKDTATADLKCVDITDAGTITAKTDVLTDSSESWACALFIDQDTNDLYAIYIRGGTWGATTTVYYKKSADGGATWGNEQAMQANAADDERQVSVGSHVPTAGGMVLPLWQNDDTDILYCNTDNAVTIAAASGGSAAPLGSVISTLAMRGAL